MPYFGGIYFPDVDGDQPGPRQKKPTYSKPATPPARPRTPVMRAVNDEPEFGPPSPPKVKTFADFMREERETPERPTYPLVGQNERAPLPPLVANTPLLANTARSIFAAASPALRELWRRTGISEEAERAKRPAERQRTYAELPAVTERVDVMAEPESFPVPATLVPPRPAPLQALRHMLLGAEPSENAPTPPSTEWLGIPQEIEEAKKRGALGGALYTVNRPYETIAEPYMARLYRETHPEEMVQRVNELQAEKRKLIAERDAQYQMGSEDDPFAFSAWLNAPQQQRIIDIDNEIERLSLGNFWQNARTGDYHGYRAMEQQRQGITLPTSPILTPEQAKQQRADDVEWYRQNASPVRQFYTAALTDPLNVFDLFGGYVTDAARVANARRFLKPVEVVVDGLKRAPTPTEMEKLIRTDWWRTRTAWGKVTNWGPLRPTAEMKMNRTVENTQNFMTNFRNHFITDAATGKHDEAAWTDAFLKWIKRPDDPEVIGVLGDYAKSWESLEANAIVRKVIGKADDTKTESALARLRRAEAELEAAEKKATIAEPGAVRRVEKATKRVDELTDALEVHKTKLAEAREAVEAGKKPKSVLDTAEARVRKTDRDLLDAKKELDLRKAKTTPKAVDTLADKRKALDTARTYYDEVSGDVDITSVKKIIADAGDDKFKAVADLAKHYEDAALSFYGVEKKIVGPDGMTRTVYEMPKRNAVGRMQSGINNLLSMGFMGYNPGYAFRNAANNLITAVADGVNPFTTTEWMDDFFLRWGTPPAATLKGIGSAGDVWKSPTTALAAIESAKKTMKLKDAFKGIDWKKGPTLQLAQNFERLASQRIMYHNLDKYWRQIWPETVRTLSAKLRTEFPTLDEKKIDYFIRRVGTAMSPSEVKAALDEMSEVVTDLGRIPTPEIVDEVAREIGGSAVDELEKVARLSPPARAAYETVLEEATKEADEAATAVARVTELADKPPELPPAPPPTATRDETFDYLTTHKKSLLEYIRELRKIETEFVLTQQERTRKVWEIARGLSWEEADMVWERYWSVSRKALGDMYDVLDGVEDTLGPTVGFTPEAIKRAKDYRKFVSTHREDYSKKLRETWERSRAVKRAGESADAIWEEWYAWSNAHYSKKFTRDDAFIEERTTDIMEAIIKGTRSGKIPPDADPLTGIPKTPDDGKPPASGGGAAPEPVEPKPVDPAPAPAADPLMPAPTKPVPEVTSIADESGASDFPTAAPPKSPFTPTETAAPAAAAPTPPEPVKPTAAAPEPVTPVTPAAKRTTLMEPPAFVAESRVFSGLPGLADDYIPVFRGTGPDGLKNIRPSDDGMLGPGVYFYTRPQDASAYAERGGGIITGFVKKSDAKVNGKVVVVDSPDKFIRRGDVPTEETLDFSKMDKRANDALAAKPPEPRVAPEPAKPTTPTVPPEIIEAANKAGIPTAMKNGAPMDKVLLAFARKHVDAGIDDVRNLTPEQTVQLFDELEKRAAERAGMVQRVDDAVKQVQVHTHADINTAEVNLDPVRFQYKLETDSGTGVTKQFDKVKMWNPAFGKGISVWVDPADGKTYVVNGHHRVELAKRFGVEKIDAPYYIQAKDANEARLIGAMQNIAEGRGTPVDAGKVFRELGVDSDMLDRWGLALSESKVSQGIALAGLNDALFMQVINKQLPLDVAVTIGEKLPGQADMQMQLARIIEQQAEKGDKLSAGVVSEMADAMASGPIETFTQATLFGDEEVVSSLFIERHKLLDYARGRIAREKSVFGGAAKNAEELKRVGSIDAAAAKEIKTAAERNLEIFDTVKNQRGPVSDLTNQFAQALARGDKNAKEDYYRLLVDDALPRALRGDAGDITPAPRPDDARTGSPDLGELGETRPRPTEGQSGFGFDAEEEVAPPRQTGKGLFGIGDEAEETPPTPPTASDALLPELREGAKRDPWQMTRANANSAFSINDMAEPIRTTVYAEIEKSPSYAQLKEAIDNYKRRLKTPPLTSPEEYIEYTVSDVKSAISKTIDNLQQKVLAESGIKELPQGTMRGRRIDWHYENVKRALAEGKPVPPEVLADYPDLAKLQSTPFVIGDTVTATTSKSGMAGNSGAREEVTGKVLRIDDDMVLLDVNGKSRWARVENTKPVTPVTPDVAAKGSKVVAPVVDDATIAKPVAPTKAAAESASKIQPAHVKKGWTKRDYDRADEYALDRLENDIIPNSMGLERRAFIQNWFDRANKIVNSTRTDRDEWLARWNRNVKKWADALDNDDALDFTTPKPPDALGAVAPGTERAFVVADAAAISMKKFAEVIRKMKAGESMPVGILTPEEYTALLAWAKKNIYPAMTSDKALVSRLATQMRNFALGDYTHKRNFHQLLTAIYPYAYWYSFTYPNWAVRLAQHPTFASNYARGMQLINDTNREWYRRESGDPNAELPPQYEGVFRMSLAGTPIHMNVMQTLNPLYGITGQNFNRSELGENNLFQKANQLGPTTWSPYGWVYAAMLATGMGVEKNMDAAAQVWGYTLPQERIIKGLGAIARDKIPGADKVIPAGGWTPSMLLPWNKQGDYWTVQRFPKELIRLYKAGSFSEEALQAAGYKQENEAWNQAKQAEAMRKFLPDLMSFMLGQGFKPRDLTDVELDQMRQAKKQTQAISKDPNATKEQKSAAWDALKEKYPWYDIYNMAFSRDPKERLHSFTWLAFNRLPPGPQQRQLLAEAGLSDALIDKWYADTRDYDFSGWTDIEFREWQLGIDKLAEKVMVPDDATKAEYDAAKTESDSITAAAAEAAGMSLEDWRALQDQYYAYPEGSAERRAMLQQYPQLDKGWDAGRAAKDKASDTYKKYYETDAATTTGATGTPTDKPGERKVTVSSALQKAVNDNKEYEKQAKQKYGTDILDLNRGYGGMSDAEKRAYKSQYPEEYARLKAFWDWRSDVWEPAHPEWTKEYRNTGTSTGTTTNKSTGTGAATGADKTGSLSGAEYAQKRVEATKLFGKDILTLADQYTALSTAQRKAWREKNASDYQRLTQYWDFIYGPRKTSSNTYNANYSGGRSYGGYSGGGYSRYGSSGGGGATQPLPPAPPPQLLTGAAWESWGPAEFNAVWQPLIAADPALPQRVQQQFGAQSWTLLQQWLTMTPEQRKAWLAANPQAWSLIRSLMYWIMAQKAGATNSGRVLDSIPPNVKPPPPESIPTYAPLPPAPPIV